MASTVAWDTVSVSRTVEVSAVTVVYAAPTREPVPEIREKLYKPEPPPGVKVTVSPGKHVDARGGDGECRRRVDGDARIGCLTRQGITQPDDRCRGSSRRRVCGTDEISQPRDLRVGVGARASAAGECDGLADIERGRARVNHQRRRRIDGHGCIIMIRCAVRHADSHRRGGPGRRVGCTYKAASA